jgi:hypothetical protein
MTRQLTRLCVLLATLASCGDNVEPAQIDAITAVRTGRLAFPTKAKVNELFVTLQSASVVFAATDIGLYKSADGGATWALAGFQGLAIRGVGRSSANAAHVVVGVNDGAGRYRAR